MFVFGEFELDPERRTLRRSGMNIDLQPNAFDLLLHLIRNRDRVLGKDELLDAVWKKVAVSEASLSFAVKLIRRALGETASERRFIETIHGRGFRFVGDCRESTAVAPPAAALEEKGALLGRAPLIGRTGELAALRAVFEDTLSGITRFVLISGEPGIGKTRLALELSAYAEARGAGALIGTCDENAPPAFWPWVQVVAAWVRSAPADAVRSVAGSDAPDLARLVPDLVGLSGAPMEHDLDPEARSVRLHHALVGFVGRAALLRPLVLLLDDIQWADTPSLLTLRLLLTHPPRAPLLVVSTCREDEAEGENLVRLLAVARREPSTVTVRLGGLSDAESGQLLEQLAGATTAAPARTSLTALAEGNPFFIEEVYRHLVEEGDLDSKAIDPAAMALQGGAARGVREIIGRRLRRLSADALAALTTAAVIGREFQFATVAAAGGSRRTSCSIFWTKRARQRSSRRSALWAAIVSATR